MKVKNLKFVFLGLTVLMSSAQAMAQMSDPREKFSITAAVTGVTNADYTWSKPEGTTVADGRSKRDVRVTLASNIQLLKTKQLTLSLSPFYDFSTQRLETEWGSAPLTFDLPTEHHRYGGSLTVNYQLKAWGKPLTLLAMGTGNFSRYGYENAQGLAGAMLTLVRNRNTSLTVGAIYLLGTAVVWPAYPMIVYWHKFNDRWSINCMGVYNYLYYHVNPTLKYSLGMELQTDKFYFRPNVEGLPRKAQLSQLAERVGIFADWQASKTMAFNIGTGVTVPFYCRLQESGYNTSYMNLKSSVKPFVRVKAKMSIFRK